MRREERRQRGVGSIQSCSVACPLAQGSSAEVQISTLVRTATPPATDRRDLEGMGEGSEGVRCAWTGGRFCWLLIKRHRRSVG